MCRVVTLGKVVVPDINEANEGLSFTAYILMNVDAKFMLFTSQVDVIDNYISLLYSLLLVVCS